MIAKVLGHPDIYVTSLSAYTAVAGAQVNKITAVADVAGSLNNKYFILPAVGLANIYVVWMNVNSAGTAPNIDNTTNVEIALATGAADTAVGLALRTALNGLPEFTAAGTNEECDLTGSSNGRYPIPYNDPDHPLTATGFTFADSTPGITGVPASTFIRIVGTIFVDDTRWDASVTGSYRPMRFAKEAINIIIPSTSVVEILED